VVDGLDEATRDGRNEIATLLGAKLRELPPWLRLVLTSRPEEREISVPLAAIEPYRIDLDAAAMRHPPLYRARIGEP
jgi:hypothetical protein